MIYDYRQGSGHEVNECFMLHGYPNWYKKLKEQRGKSISVSLAETSMNQANESIAGESARDSPFINMSILIQQEIEKYLSGKMNSGIGNG